MNKNIAIILSIAAILITLTCVGATVINSDGDMKQNTFDGIKINVPHELNLYKYLTDLKKIHME